MRLIIGNVQTPANPLLRAVSLILGAVVFVAALVFGAVLFALVIGIVVILAAIAAARVWWIARKLRAASGEARVGSARSQTHFSRSGADEAAGGRIIEGEYTDVSESSRENRGRHESS